MKTYQDLPCRLVIVIGSQSGGTSATAGILTRNGFYNQTKTGSFEATSTFVHLFPSPWIDHTRRQLKDQDFDDFSRWARRYKDTAIQEGFTRAVHKWPGNPIWVPELFTGHCGITVCPLLVWRDPEKCAASIERRWGNRLKPHLAQNGYKDVLELARVRMRRIEELRDQYGWPMWRFGVDATQEQLEQLLNVKLPVQYLETDQIQAA